MITLSAGMVVGVSVLVVWFACAAAFVCFAFFCSVDEED